MTNEADAPETDREPEMPELFLDAGAVWIADARELCGLLGAVGFANGDGCAVALIPGKGEVSLAKSLQEVRLKGATVRAIRVARNDAD